MSDKQPSKEQPSLDYVGLPEVQTVEEAQLESRTVPKLEMQELPQGIGARLLIRLTRAQADKQLIVMSAILFVLVTFVPLLFLCVFDGTAWEGIVEIPLFADYITLSRLLIVAPILILSDILTRPYLIKAAKHFLGTFIEPTDADRYNQMFKRVFRVRNSLLLDWILLLIALISSCFYASVVIALDVSSWQMTSVMDSPVLSLAGKWNSYVAQPLFRFVIMSWFLDYLLWTYFLFKVSRYKLNIIATHPDGVGGLGFVTVAQSHFCVAAFALSADISCVVIQLVQYGNAKLQSFANLGIVFLAVILVIFVGPLLVFTPMLLTNKKQAVFSYGSLGHETSKIFAKKWLIDRSENVQSIVSSPDASALGDLGSVYKTVSDMSPFVFDKRFVILIAVSALLPALPLVATVMPLKELLMQLFKMLT